jgi:hypothetical protein
VAVIVVVVVEVVTEVVTVAVTDTREMLTSRVGILAMMGVRYRYATARLNNQRPALNTQYRTNSQQASVNQQSTISSLFNQWAASFDVSVSLETT